MTSVAVLSDGCRALSGSWDNTLCLWDIETGAELRRLEWHTFGVTSVAVLPGSRHALLASGHNKLCLWDIETGAELARYIGDVAFTALALMPNNQVLTGNQLGQVASFRLPP